MVASMLGWIGSFFKNLFSSTLSFLSNLFGHLFDGLIKVLKFLFNPLLILVAAIFYFVYKLGELVVTLLAVLLAIGKLLYSFVIGLFKTLAGFVWTPATATADHGQWSGAVGEVFVALEPYQLDKIAYVLMFAIWIMTGWAAIKILSSRGAGDQ